MSSHVGTDLGRRPQHYLTLKDAGAALAKHLGVAPGLYNVVVEFQVAIANIGPTAEDQGPGVAARVNGFGLEPTTEVGLLTIEVKASDQTPT